MLPAVGKLWTRYGAPDTLIPFYGRLTALLLSTGVVFEKTFPRKPPDSSAQPSRAICSPDPISGRISAGFMPTAAGITNHGEGAFDTAVSGIYILTRLRGASRAIRGRRPETAALAVFPIVTIPCFIPGISQGSRMAVTNRLIFNRFTRIFGLMHFLPGCRNVKLHQLSGGMAVLSLLLVTRFCDGEFYIHRARDRTISENTRFSFQTRPTDPAVPARPILHERGKGAARGTACIRCFATGRLLGGCADSQRPGRDRRCLRGGRIYSHAFARSSAMT